MDDMQDLEVPEEAGEGGRLRFGMSDVDRNLAFTHNMPE